MRSSRPSEIPKSESHDILRAHLVLLYRNYLSDLRPADQFLGGYLRKNKKLRGAARGFLGAVFYWLLRHRVSLLLRIARTEGVRLEPIDELTQVISVDEEAALAVLYWLSREIQAPPEEALALTLAAIQQASILEGGRGIEPHLRRRIEWFLATLEGKESRPTRPTEVQLAEQCSIPVELMRTWIGRFGAEQAAALGQSMLEPAPLDLRVNNRKSSPKTVRKLLGENDIPAEPSRFATNGLRLLRKVNLARLSGFEDGMVEIQDEGSQLVSEAPGVQTGWKVLDACAGGGGKTLHLSELVGEGGSVYAHDSDSSRLEALRKRKQSAEADNILILQPGKHQEHAPYDAVLIDAPCMGLGRLRREPTIPWRGDYGERLATAMITQSQCLESYAPLVKSNGIIVYAVCSFQEEETTEIIKSFLSCHPEYRPEALPSLFQKEAFAATRSPDGSQVTLLPSHHGTDGFFIARLRRT